MAGKSNGVDTTNWARAPPTSGPLWVRICKAIYDPEDKSFLGRTPKRWGELKLLKPVFCDCFQLAAVRLLPTFGFLLGYPFTIDVFLHSQCRKDSSYVYSFMTFIQTRCNVKIAHFTFSLMSFILYNKYKHFMCYFCLKTTK